MANEAGRGDGCASDAMAVVAAHPIEGSMRKEDVLVRHGAHLDVVKSGP